MVRWRNIQKERGRGRRKRKRQRNKDTGMQINTEIQGERQRAEKQREAT